MAPDRPQGTGYLSTGTATYSTGGYALACDPVRLAAVLILIPVRLAAGRR